MIFPNAYDFPPNGGSIQKTGSHVIGSHGNGIQDIIRAERFN